MLAYQCGEFDAHNFQRLVGGCHYYSIQFPYGLSSPPEGTSVRTSASHVRPPQNVQIVDDTVAEARWLRRVAEAVHRIETNGLEKVLLARSVIAQAAEPIDVRHLVGTLAADFPTCWTYSVDGLVGASPEMLVRRELGLATSRILAGTIRRSGSEETDLKLASALARSSKNLGEHELAVESVAKALAPLRCGILNADHPRRMELFSGCGIVEGSDPEEELAETKAKLVPMVSALVS